jgi:hypothetical protein
MIRPALPSHGPHLAHDLEALTLAAGTLVVLFALSLVSALWPDGL